MTPNEYFPFFSSRFSIIFLNYYFISFFTPIRRFCNDYFPFTLFFHEMFIFPNGSLYDVWQIANSATVGIGWCL